MRTYFNDSPTKNHVFAPKPFPREELFNPSRRYMNPELM
jgi:hypothetical protein